MTDDPRIDAARRAAYSRRAFIGRAGTSAFALSSLSTLLAACGGIEGSENADEERTTDVRHERVPIEQLNFTNWPLYIDKNTLKTFERRTGGSVKYSEEINDNEEFFGKVRPALQQGRAIGRDIVVLTDWMAAKWVRLGYLEPIDKRNIPNVGRRLTPNLRSPEWDPERNYSVPWQSGMTAIGYNPKLTGRKLNSVDDLFDPEFKGKVTMLTDPRDSGGLVLLGMGVKAEDATIDQMLEAIEKIREENDKGQIRRFTGNDYTTELAKGNVWVSVAYSGDVVQLQADNPELEFVVPEEGALLWSDNMLIPQKPEHPYAAEAMMNFAYEPEIAAANAAEINYVTPVEGAREVLEKDDPELASNQLIFPDEETRSRLSAYPSFDEQEERRMLEAMQQVVGA